MQIGESVVQCLSNYSVYGIPSEFPERACCQPASYPKNIRDFRWKFASFNQSGNFNRFHAQLSQQSSCGEAKLREGVKKKNCEKAVRLTAWVDPPLPSPEAVRKM